MSTGLNRAQPAQAACDAGDVVPAATLATRIRDGWRLLRHAGRMLVGMPDYDVYRTHLREHHPEREPMTREAFFRSRQEARYRGGTGRCC